MFRKAVVLKSKQYIYWKLAVLLYRSEVASVILFNNEELVSVILFNSEE